MVEQQLERGIKAVGDGLANLLREQEPDITDVEINEASRNFVEFIRVLRAMDAEQKVKRESI